MSASSSEHPEVGRSVNAAGIRAPDRVGFGFAERPAYGQCGQCGQCGHWTQIEHAARFAQLVGNFLAEAAAGAEADPPTSLSR